MTVAVTYLDRIAHHQDWVRPTDLLTNETYNAMRPQFLAIGRAHKAPRRLRLDENLSLLFETRVTVWLQIQEELRWLKAPRIDQIEEILLRNNPLVPAPARLTASLFVDGSRPAEVESLVSSVSLASLNLSISIAGCNLSSEPVDPNQRELVAVNYISFKPVGLCSRRGEIRWTTNQQQSAQLPALLHNTLIDDLIQVGPRSLSPTRTQFVASSYV